MGLREIRKSRNLTQKELARQSGVNFRSLQDYEQGHKRLISASGDILLRLSTVLGCTTDELLLESIPTAPFLENQMDICEIHDQRFFCEQYRTAGKWVCTNNGISTFFYYNGKQYALPFRAVFTSEMLPCLKAAAVLQMEAKIEEILLQSNGFERW